RRQADPDELQPLKTTPIIKEVAKLIKAALPANINLKLHFEARDDLILGTPGPLHQILINLCNNAAQAMGSEEGQLTIATGNLAEKNGKASLLIQVSDTGPGIAEEHQHRIFDPYFTTRSFGDGAGLGLATVHGLIRKLKGKISFNSERGRGTTFTITLPIFSRQENSHDTLSDFLKLPTGCEELLLVEDESEILKVNQLALEKLGYRVCACPDGAAALEIFLENPQRFDLILTDIAMPKMTGDRLAREVLQRRPELPIIVGTGYSENFSREEALALGVREYYHKPLSTDRLARLLRRVLNQSHPPVTG
ncbi:MAG: response regulator, partial [Deltaproteobacteria bacterium]|nr:response regulator [Deltaproteobacteria bacterium]